MKFTDDTKQVKEFSDGNWFAFGIHKVQIVSIGLDKTDDGKEFVEVEVVGENGEEDKARVWFTTEKAANFSFNVLRQIYVHNAPDDKKDEARDTMDAVKTTDELVEKLQERLLGKECWFTKYLDPTRTYTNKQTGEVKQSVNKNIYGYEPKLHPELMPKEAGTGNAAVDSTFPGAKTADEAAGGIPSSW